MVLVVFTLPSVLNHHIFTYVGGVVLFLGLSAYEGAAVSYKDSSMAASICEAPSTQKWGEKSFKFFFFLGLFANVALPLLIVNFDAGLASDILAIGYRFSILRQRLDYLVQMSLLSSVSYIISIGIFLVLGVCSGISTAIIFKIHSIDSGIFRRIGWREILYTVGICILCVSLVIYMYFFTNPESEGFREGSDYLLIWPEFIIVSIFSQVVVGFLTFSKIAICMKLINQRGVV